MHKSLKILVALSVVLIIIGGAGSLLTANSVVKSESAKDTTVVDADTITDIEIEAVNEKISVEKADDNNQAKVKWSGKTAADDKDRLSVETNNGKLSIEKDSESFYLFSLGTDLQEFFNKQELIVSLPEKTYNTIKMINGNGQVTMDDLEANDIKVENTNGKVDLNNLTAEDVTINMTNGKLSMNNVAGDVTGRTVKGEINLITPDLDRDIDLSTTTGRITVQTEKRPTNALLDAHTDVGKVSLFDGEDRKTVYGDGDHHIKLTTTAGLIRVEEKNDRE